MIYGECGYIDHVIKFQVQITNIYIDYHDSSPSPIGSAKIKTLIPETEFVYKELHNEMTTNTYPLVVRDFMLSNDSDNGAFILPHDEFLIINYNEFNNLAPAIPFSCGKQLSF